MLDRIIKVNRCRSIDLLVEEYGSIDLAIKSFLQQLNETARAFLFRAELLLFFPLLFVSLTTTLTTFHAFQSFTSITNHHQKAQTTSP